MKTREVIKIMKDISDYLVPFQTPYEQAIYNYLFRWSYVESGINAVRKGERTIAIGIGRASGVGGHGSGRVSYGAVSENMNNLEKKGHIKIGDTTREGTLYTVLLPREIDECAKLKEKLEGSKVSDDMDYFNVSENRMKIFERDNYICHYCGDKVMKDKVYPYRKGGDNSKNNLVTCCLECNSVKTGRTKDEAAIYLLESLRLRKLRSES